MKDKTGVPGGDGDAAEGVGGDGDSDVEGCGGAVMTWMMLLQSLKTDQNVLAAQ